MRTSSSLRFSFGLYLLALFAAASAQNAVTTRPASVYAGPDDSYPMVAELDADAPVQVMGCLDDWSWCDVAFADNRGWVYAPDIIYDYEGDYVPFYTYAPSFGVPIVQFVIGDYWGRYYHGRPWYAQRDEWEHRSLPQHRRPAGPPPSAGPPPRSARVERPSHESLSDRSVRLGSSERPSRDADRRDGVRDNRDVRPPAPRPAEGGSADVRAQESRTPNERVPDARASEGRAPDVRAPNVRAPESRAPDGRAPEPRSAEHVSPPGASNESNSRPPERAAPPPRDEHQHGNAEPPRREERAPAPNRAEGSRHDETRHGDKLGDRPNDTPH